MFDFKNIFSKNNVFYSEIEIGNGWNIFYRCSISLKLSGTIIPICTGDFAVKIIITKYTVLNAIKN